MKTCGITILNHSFVRLQGMSQPDFVKLKAKFAKFVDGYYWMPLYKLGRWDGKVHFISDQGQVALRLMPEVIPEIVALGYDVDIVEDARTHFDSPPPITDSFFDVEMGFKPFKIRPYQVEAVNIAIEAQSGIIVAGTGAGKTTITAALSESYAKMGYRVLTIVPSDDLVTQTTEWYQQLQMDVGVYSGSNKDIDHPNVVATWQALQYNPAIVGQFDCIIWDEAHGVRAKVAGELLNNHAKNVPFKFGVTGTLPKDATDAMTIKAALGEQLTEITAAWLIENGYLSKVDIQPIELDETYIQEDFPDYASERAFLTKSPDRMAMIANIIISQAEARGNTLVLVGSIKFGQQLAALIKGAVFLSGTSPKDLRKEHYQMFEENDNLIVIASYGIASTGISIDRIFGLFLIDAGKGFIRAIQSIGRGLRRGRDKDYVMVYDVHSKKKWSKKHYKDRLKYYKEAQYPVSEVLKVKIKKTDQEETAVPTKRRSTRKTNTDLLK